MSSYGSGPPEPPPLRKSRWSWWKPVKGTSVTDDYYYNASSRTSESNDDSRPGSRNSRSSLSVLDNLRDETRREVVARHSVQHDDWPLKSDDWSLKTQGWPLKTETFPLKPTSLTADMVKCPEISDTTPRNHGDNPLSGTGPDSGGSTDRPKNNRKSTSRPPPAFYNRPHHQRYYPASPTLQRTSSNYNNDLVPLTAQPEDPTMRLFSSKRSASVQIDSSAPPIAVGPATAATKADRRQSSYYRPGSNDFAIIIDVPAKDKAAKGKKQDKAPKAPREKKQDYAIIIDAPPARETVIRDKRKSWRDSEVLLAPAVDPALEALPIPGGRPSIGSRRGSSSTVATFNTAFSSRDGLESRGRASSWGSQTSLESAALSPQKAVPAGRLSYADYQVQLKAQMQLRNREHRAPWRQTQRPALIKTFRKKAKPGELFAALPGEVLELILEELKKLHLQPGSDSCATCWMRDCCSVALSARKWLKFARGALYEDIWLVGGEGAVLKKRYKINPAARLVLLRRTLRTVSETGAIVRSLKVPSLLPPEVTVERYYDLVASLVMACPNLERLVGFYPPYGHAFSKLFHALSTRQQLKEMNWIVEPSPFQRQQTTRPGDRNSLVAPGDLQPQQANAFLDHHVNWHSLTTLTVHCRPGATLTPTVLLTDALRHLPALQHLHLSHLPHTSFDDTTLLSLPALQKLTLSNLPGVTTDGLTSFATRRTSRSLTTLHLINLNIALLPVLARILSNLTALTVFSLVQPTPPTMPTDEFLIDPYLASPTLRKLHWDVPYLPSRASPADATLASSIAAGGFPRLRVLRAPHDPEGLFQAVCAPRERVDCPADRYRSTNTNAIPAAARETRSRSSSVFSAYRRGSNGGAPAASSRAGSRAGSILGGVGKASSRPPSPAGPGPVFAPPAEAEMWLALSRENSDLRAARVAAQGRLEAARGTPRYFVNVVDEEGYLVEKFGVGAFVGTVESRVRYHLLPDAGGTDEGGGLAGVREMLCDNGEDVGVAGLAESGAGSERANRRSSIGVFGKKERGTRERSRSRGRRGEEEKPVKIRDGCTGRWNANEAAPAEKKDRERWQHAERARWRPVVLS